MKKLPLLLFLIAFYCGGCGVSSELNTETPEQLGNSNAGLIPAIETICGEPKTAGYGLCVAACESALIEKDTTSRAFERVAANYEKKTGETLPCLAVSGCIDGVAEECGAQASTVCDAIFDEITNRGNETSRTANDTNPCTGDVESASFLISEGNPRLVHVTYPSGDVRCLERFSDGSNVNAIACLDNCGLVQVRGTPTNPPTPCP